MDGAAANERYQEAHLTLGGDILLIARLFVVSILIHNALSQAAAVIYMADKTKSDAKHGFEHNSTRAISNDQTGDDRSNDRSSDHGELIKEGSAAPFDVEVDIGDKSRSTSKITANDLTRDDASHALSEVWSAASQPFIPDSSPTPTASPDTIPPGRTHVYKALASLCSASITTFICNELPALRAHLTDYHLAELNDFVAEHYSGEAGNKYLQLKPGDNFLFRNSLSVCAKLYLPMLREVRDEQVIPIRELHLALEVERMEKAKDLDELIEEKREKADVKAAVKEGRKRGGIGMADGKVVFGPVKPRELEDEDHDDGPPMAMPFYVNKDSLDVMGRLSD